MQPSKVKIFFPVILHTDAVAVSKGQSGFVRLGTEDAFAFIVFAQGKGAGQVTQELGAVVSQYLRCIQLIVFGPAVFAEHDADGDARTFDVDSDRLYCFGYAAVFFEHNLCRL